MKHHPKWTPVQGCGGEWTYDDGDVVCVLGTDLGDSCEILEFTSLHPRMGNGRAAVEWLRRRFATVGVNDPGNEEDAPESFAFWRSVARHGLVDYMLDGNGVEIYSHGLWHRERLDPENYGSLLAELTGESSGVIGNGVKP